MTWYTFNRVNQTEKTAEIQIYGDIGDGWQEESVSASQFITQFKKLAEQSIKQVIIRINSLGGNAFDGLAMYSVIKSSDMYVTVMIDGIAASAATLPAMAADKLIIPSNALFMMHNPWAGVVGDQDDMLKAVKMLNQTKSAIIVTYQAKSGQSAEKISAWMDDETWWTGQEAVDKGFADELSTAITLNNKLAEFNFSRFSHPPVCIAAMAQPKKDNNVTITTVTDVINRFPDIAEELIKQGESRVQNQIVESRTQGVHEERQRVELLIQAAKPDERDALLNAIKTGQNAGDFAIAMRTAEQEQGVTLNQLQQDVDYNNPPLPQNQRKTSPLVMAANKRFGTQGVA